MTAQAWVALLALSTTLVVMGVRAYIRVREDLASIKKLLTNGLPSSVAALAERVGEVENELSEHIGWSKARSAELGRRLNEKA